MTVSAILFVYENSTNKGLSSNNIYSNTDVVMLIKFDCLYTPRKTQLDFD